jgi:mRNA interferase YafQ
MLKIEYSNQFKRDFKLAKKRGKKLSNFENVLKSLALKEPLAQKYHNHKLTGNMEGFYECHLEPDYLLVYEYIEDTILLKGFGNMK